jgi:hypothetical protein
MNFDPICAELFGASTVAESLDPENPVIQRQPPQLPIDDPLFPFSPSDGAADSLCKRLERDTLIAELLGDTEDQATRGLTHLDELLEKREPRHDFISDVMTYVSRSQRIAKRAPERRRVIAGFINDFVKRLGAQTANHEPQIAALQHSCEEFITQNLMEVRA